MGGWHSAGPTAHSKAKEAAAPTAAGVYGAACRGGTGEGTVSQGVPGGGARGSQRWRCRLGSIADTTTRKPPRISTTAAVHRGVNVERPADLQQRCQSVAWKTKGNGCSCLCGRGVMQAREQITAQKSTVSAATGLLTVIG